MSVGLAVLGHVEVDVAGSAVPLTRLEATLLAARSPSPPTGPARTSRWPTGCGEDLPRTPRNRTQALISGLRRKVGSVPLVETTPQGYRLAAEVSLDVARWRALVRRALAVPAGEPSRALLHEAVAAVCPEPLGGCVRTPRVEAARRSLVDERLRLLGARIDADLAVGPARRTGRRAHPPRRGAALPRRLRCAARATVLARSGRRAEAMATFTAARMRLDAEARGPPGPLLAAAHAALVGGHPTMANLPGSPPGPGWPTSPDRAPCPQRLRRHRSGGRVRPDRRCSTRTRRSRRRQPVGIGGVGRRPWRSRRPTGSAEASTAAASRTCPARAVTVAQGRSSTHSLGILGVRGPDLPQPLADRAAVLRSILDDRRILIVLDDVPDGFDVTPAAPPRPSSMAILTSRQPLRPGPHPPDPARVTRPTTPRPTARPSWAGSGGA